MELYIDSNIEGEFEGWDEGKTFKLDNGSEWELSSFQFSFSFSFRPSAKIWRDGGRYFLEVEGMSDKVEVNQL